MYKLLFVTTVPQTLRAFLLEYAEYFQQEGWEVDAMANGITECSVCKDIFNKVWDVNWSRNPFQLAHFVGTPNIIRKIAEQEKYDIIHVHTPVASFVTRYALRKTKRRIGVKIIYTVHGFHFYQGGNLYKNIFYKALEKIAGKWTDYLVVINKEDEQNARNYICSPNKVIFMPGIGINTDYYNPHRISDEEISLIRCELGLKHNDRLFLMIAEFNPGKRHYDVLKAFSRITRNDIHIAFAGDGILKNKTMQLTEALGISSRVHFLGFRNDIPALIKTSVATILPSEREGLPRSVMESMAMGVPVIASDIRGNKDLVGREAGLLFKTGSIESLTNAMNYILDNPVEAIHMAEIGQKNTISTYDIKHVIKEHENLYQRVLKNN